MQVDVGPQWMPHPPQLSSSVIGSMHPTFGHTHGEPSWQAQRRLRLKAPGTHMPLGRVAARQVNAPPPTPPWPVRFVPAAPVAGPAPAKPEIPAAPVRGPPAKPVELPATPVAV